MAIKQTPKKKSATDSADVALSGRSPMPTRKAPRGWYINMVPVPPGGMTPKEGHRWLNEDLERWIGLLQVGFAVRDEEVREDFGALCSDVDVLATASLYAVRTRQTVRFELDEPGGPDFRDFSESMARILTARSYYEGDGGPAALAFDELARGLLERLRIGNGEERVRGAPASEN